ncbi:CHAT domain-containing protein [Suillus fuscotomentosus]|uniref:CHAT domain-containing protein n=1 Tax=Suillus fuscotomentosus TaxID=1912939 RepID=A0AAD4DNL6_9AGAM|nr:CHAT domain-containing protein [Suillus fuscotomentosus]KAG1886815.1 CHAT domain-containing protein [Suillus fuscotomentosus]
MLPLLLNQLAHRAERYLQRDEMCDLDEVISLHYDALAIALHREALVLFPVGHTDWSTSLKNLVNVLTSRFDHQGNDEDMDQAITLDREALALCPVGNDEDLDQAITLLREALAMHPSLNNLAALLSSRFDRRGNDEDLDQAITLLKEVLALHPVGHTDGSMSSHNLAKQLSSCFHHRGNDKDLDEAIALHREALALFPVGHTNRSLSLNSLTNQLYFRFQHRGNDEDLDQAIALHREALALCPVGHTDRSFNDKDLDQAIALHREALTLHPDTTQLSSRFDRQGNDEDLDQAIALDREALALHPVGHTDRPGSLHNLTNRLSSRFDHQGNDEDLDQAIALHREALALRQVSHTDRSLSLNNLARQLSTRFEHRHNREDLVESREKLSCEDTDNLNAAMHHLKIAANVVSGGLLSHLQVSLLWVSCAHQHRHGTQLEAYATSMQLLDAYMSKTASVLSRHNIMKDFPNTLAINAASCALHSGDIEGFSHFLLPPLFSDLQNVACDGPIILLIASQSCHAIVIPYKKPPTSIQLPTDLLKLANLVLRLRRAVEKDANLNGKQTALTKALRELWDIVICPVVNILDGFAQQGSKIWWCLTSLFNFLPLHAAGEYRPKGKSVSQQYISSYTPSLTALIKACTSHVKSPSIPFVAIGQDCPAGASFTLDAVEPELELITSVNATKLTALHALRDNTWLHLACHGTQKFDEPFKSAFLMRNKPLSLLDIMQMDLSRHEFAFLSACQTAVGDFMAGLQFAGFNSIMGTMWKVTDSTVQHLVEAFYKNMRGDAAWALHQAVQLLALFVHIGI